MELMLWMKEKGLVVVDEPSQEPRNILQKLKRHEAAERELLATHGHVEGLQQVGALDRGCRAYSFLSSLPRMFSWNTLIEGRIDFSYHAIRIPQLPPSLSWAAPGLSTQTNPQTFYLSFNFPD